MRHKNCDFVWNISCTVVCVGVLPLVLLLLGEPLLLDAVLFPGLEPDVSPELLLCVFVPSTAWRWFKLKKVYLYKKLAYSGVVAFTIAGIVAGIAGERHGSDLTSSPFDSGVNWHGDVLVTCLFWSNIAGGCSS